MTTLTSNSSVPAHKLLIMSTVLAHAFPQSSREGSSKTLRRDSESHQLCRWGGKRFRWFQVFFGLSCRACRIAFLTAHVREGLEVFMRRLALEPPADRSAPMVCRMALSSTGRSCLVPKRTLLVFDMPHQTQDRAPPAAMVHHKFIQMDVDLLIRQHHCCNQVRTQDLLFCLSLTIGKASSPCFCLRPTCEASGCYAVRIPISS